MLQYWWSIWKVYFQSITVTRSITNSSSSC